MSVQLALRGIGASFGSPQTGRVDALADITLEVERHTLVSLVGPSGCGKSTLLRIAAGLTRPTCGSVTLAGQPVHGPSAERGMVFQSYSLFPWLNVLDNVAFGPRRKGLPRAECRRVAAEHIRLVGLEGFERALPKQLSGGMMQRAAIARALANEPAMLLMDEPFGALDAQTREEMQDFLEDVRRRKPMTILFVTHDVDEALRLADRVCVLSARPGRLVMDEAVPAALSADAPPAADDPRRALRARVLRAIRQSRNGM